MMLSLQIDYVFIKKACLLAMSTIIELVMKGFSPQEDHLIREMYDRQGIKKWGMIATAITDKLGIPRNSKQCRDRYREVLDPEVTPDWTAEQQQKMYKLHEQIGNKWAIIANYFPGKNDNCVKNHFYSKLRKALRHLNKSIKKNFKKEFKELKIGALYKIIEVLEDRFKENSIVDEGQVAFGLRLKRELLVYADEEIDQQSLETAQREKRIIYEILEFSRGYKRKSKKQRRNSLNGSDLFKSSASRQSFKCASQQQSSQSQYSFALSHNEDHRSDMESEQEEKMPLVVIEEDIRDSYNSKYSQLRNSLNIRRHEHEMVEEGIRGSQHSMANSVEQILRGKGALEYHQLQNLYLNRNMISQKSVSMKSEDQKPDMFGADDIRLSAGLHIIIDDMEEQEADPYLTRSHK